mmetsp:Transcript_11326/g.12827  ORF Transcript_11326/g.12827 Transcript_11326/m.12827 type:complete len:420 (-) Transcript_11326:1782-3041(-)
MKEAPVVKNEKVGAYGTWVSEVMLQQTRVETVIKYFLNWMQLFPDEQTLAQASPDAVNAAWAGLGYYSRARNLQKGAKKVVEDFNGVLPDSESGLLSIPGIGKYTSGAIGSIAFNKSVPLVDGNVIRVFSRICRVSLEAKDSKLIKACWDFASKLVSQGNPDPGSFNQALMELGATVCIPKAPRCGDCPVQKYCVAYKLEKDKSNVIQYPKKAKKKTLPDEVYAVTVVSRPNDKSMEYLVMQRPKKGLLAGQWQFICTKMFSRTAKEVEESENSIRNSKTNSCKTKVTTKNSFDNGTHYSTRKEETDKYLRNAIGMCVDCIDSLKPRVDIGSFIHTFSHIRHHLYVESARVDKNSECSACEFSECTTWMTKKQLHDRGLTKSMSTCLEMDENLMNEHKRKGNARPKKKMKLQMKISQFT